MVFTGVMARKICGCDIGDSFRVYTNNLELISFWKLNGYSEAYKPSYAEAPLAIMVLEPSCEKS